MCFENGHIVLCALVQYCWMYAFIQQHIHVCAQLSAQINPCVSVMVRSRILSLAYVAQFLRRTFASAQNSALLRRVPYCCHTCPCDLFWCLTSI